MLMNESSFMTSIERSAVQLEIVNSSSLELFKLARDRLRHLQKRSFWRASELCSLEKLFCLGIYEIKNLLISNFLYETMSELARKIEDGKLSSILNSIQIALDHYDDIFSDFDPSPFNQRMLSDDFL